MSNLQQSASKEPLTEREKAVHVLTRFSFGYGPDDVNNVMKVGAESWLRGQMRDTPASGSSLGQRLKDMQTLFLTPAEVRDLVDTSERVRDLAPAAQKERKQLERVPRNEILAAVLYRSIYSPHQTKEVACDFWRNHFNVSFTKGQQSFPLIPHYEQTVVRDHVFGDFGTMLRASAKHPAMLQYLDNHLSRRPPTDQELAQVERRTQRKTGSKDRAEEAAQIAAQRGLNENYARELMELHTLGVNGGYTQNDVTEFAKVITGWSMGGRGGGPEDANGFRFKRWMHEPGPKTVLGQVFEGGGESEGINALKMLAHHPSTAKFIATKLVRHFVSDTPPASAIAKIEKVFSQSQGDLAKVSEALIDLEEAWQEPLSKTKRPYELVISTYRALGIKPPNKKQFLKALGELHHTPFKAASPAGWSDKAEDWLTPETLMRRIEWTRALAAKLPRSVKPEELFADTIGAVASPQTKLWVSRAPSAEEAIALILASPEFQRR